MGSLTHTVHPHPVPPEQTPMVEVEDLRAVALQRQPEEESQLGSAGGP